jgi:serine/threonine protein kinase/GTPase SAR1 family protein
MRFASYSHNLHRLFQFILLERSAVMQDALHCAAVTAVISENTAALVWLKSHNLFDAQRILFQADERGRILLEFVKPRTPILQTVLEMLAMQQHFRAFNMDPTVANEILSHLPNPIEISLSASLNEFRYRWPSLRRLDLDENRVSSVYCPNLIFLSLRRNRIVNFEYHPNLACVEELHLEGNELRSIPAEISLLKSLRIANFSHNRISEISKHIGELAQLQALDLCHNSLKTLPKELCKLTNLTQLLLENNQLRVLPNMLALIDSLQVIQVNFNKNLEPREARHWDCAQIKSYLLGTLQGGEKCNRVKVMIVGQEAVGKSCLVRSLQACAAVKSLKIASASRQIQQSFSSYRNESTDGIDVREIAIAMPKDFGVAKNRIFLKLFDFGGQEVFSMTHSLFLTRGGIYIVAFNPLNIESRKRLVYWLSSFIGTLVNDGELDKNAKIIIVATHLDATKKNQVDEQFDAILQQSEARVLSISRRDCFAVSSQTGEGYTELLDGIRERVSKLDYFSTLFPKEFFELQRYANELALKHEAKGILPLIKLSTFEHAIPNMSMLHEALGFATRQGVLMHFDTPQLRDWIILDSRWLPRLMATLVSFRTAGIVKNGILFSQAIRTHKLWSEFESELHPFLMSLLLRFGVVIELDKERLLVPAMLGNDDQVHLQSVREAPIDAVHVVSRTYTSDFIPSDFFARLLAALVQVFAPDKCQWKSNEFTYTGAAATAVLTATVNEIKLSSWGSERSTRETFGTINHQIVSLALKKDLSLKQRAIFRNGESELIERIDLKNSKVHQEFCVVIDEELISGISEISTEGAWRTSKATLDAGEMVEIKLKELVDADAKTVSEFTREAELLHRIAHRNLVEFYGVASLNGNPTLVYENSLALPLSLQLRGEAFKCSHRERVAIDVALGMYYLHSRKPRLLHTALNSGNVFVSHDVGKAYDKSEPFARIANIGCASNRRWNAPEIEQGEPPSEQSEIFDYAVMLAEMLLHDRLSAFDPSTHFSGDIAEAITSSLHYVKADNGVICNIVVPCVDKNPAQRLTFQRCLDVICFNSQWEALRQFSNEHERASEPPFVAIQRRYSNCSNLLRSLYPEGVELHPREVEYVEKALDGAELQPILVTIEPGEPLYTIAVGSLARSRDSSLYTIQSVRLVLNAQLFIKFIEYRDSVPELMRFTDRLFCAWSAPQIRAVVQNGFDSTNSSIGEAGHGIELSLDIGDASALPRTETIYDSSNLVVAELSTNKAKAKPRLTVYTDTESRVAERVKIKRNSVLRLEGNEVITKTLSFSFDHQGVP